MKKLIFPALLLFLVGCSQKKTGKEKVMPQTKNEYDTTALKEIIIEHYKKEFQKDNSNTPEYQWKIDTNELGIDFRMIQDTTSIAGPSNIIPFAAGFIKGDLNGDKSDDIVIPVNSTSGGTAFWEDIFVFISSEGKPALFKIYSSFDLGNCKPGGSNTGQFFPKKIMNSVLIGESICYKPDDGHLGPSYRFTTEYKFDNGLVFLKHIEQE